MKVVVELEVVGGWIQVEDFLRALRRELDDLYSVGMAKYGNIPTFRLVSLHAELPPDTPGSPVG